MEDVKATNMKDERMGHGWKAQVLSLYQSLVIVIFGYISFILRLMQEYFKTGDAKWQMDEEKSKSKDNVSGKGRLRSAGELMVDEGNKMSEEVILPSEHTIVDLPPVIEKISPVVPEILLPKVEEPKENTAEPTDDQSKNTLVIKNLPFKFKPVDLDKLLSDYQSKPKNVRLLRDDTGRFSGMAFIRCASKEEAQRMISTMNGLDIGGRNIQVEFKLKKKKSKGKLDSSSDSISSSSDELPGLRLRISSEVNNKPEIKVNDAPALVVVNTQNAQSIRSNKLSLSAEHIMTETKQALPLKKAAFQPRRKSTSNAYEPNHLYVNSVISKLHRPDAGNQPNVRPIRQPIGPDGTNGFSLEYRRSRRQNV